MILSTYSAVKTRQSSTKIGQGVVLPNEHNDLYEMQFLFKWRDMNLLAGIFSIINKMFNGASCMNGYNKINVQLFHPEEMRAQQYIRTLSPPPINLRTSGSSPVRPSQASFINHGCSATDVPCPFTTFAISQYQNQTLSSSIYKPWLKTALHYPLMCVAAASPSARHSRPS